MDNEGRILYINHDSDKPAGGVKAIYTHVSLLVKNVYPAFVVHNQKGFNPLSDKKKNSCISGVKNTSIITTFRFYFVCLKLMECSNGRRINSRRHTRKESYCRKS